jgi:hypothetical protein
MKEIVVNRLRLQGKYIGYRVNLMEGTKRVVSFDVSDDKVGIKGFLKMFRSNDIKKGVVIDGTLSGNMFVTPDETNVFEVTDKACAERLLDKYYFNESSVELDDLIDITETQKEVAERKERTKREVVDCERRKKIRSLESRKPHIDSIDKFEYKDYDGIPYAYKAFAEAIKGTHAYFSIEDIGGYDEDSTLHFQGSFIDFIDFLQFTYNLRRFLQEPEMTVFSASVSTPNGAVQIASVENASVSCECSQDKFLHTILSMLALPTKDRILCEDFKISWSDDYFPCLDSEDGVFCVHENLEYPGYCELKYDSSDEYDEVEYHYSGTYLPVPLRGKQMLSTKACEVIMSASEGYLQPLADTLVDLGFGCPDHYILKRGDWSNRSPEFRKRLASNTQDSEKARKGIFKSVERYNALVENVISYINRLPDADKIRDEMSESLSDCYMSYIFER